MEHENILEWRKSLLDSMDAYDHEDAPLPSTSGAPQHLPALRPLNAKGEEPAGPLSPIDIVMKLGSPLVTQSHQTHLPLSTGDAPTPAGPGDDPKYLSSLGAAHGSAPVARDISSSGGVSAGGPASSAAGAAPAFAASDLEAYRELASGYLYKLGSSGHLWKKRYFVVRLDALYVYQDDKQFRLIRRIPITDIRGCAPVQVKRHNFVFGAVTDDRAYYLMTDTHESVTHWVRAMNEARQRQTAADTHIPEPAHHASSSSESEPEPDADPDADDHSIPNAEPSLRLRSPCPSFVTLKDPNHVLAASYLMKRGKHGTWRKRWCVLTPSSFMYSHSHADTRMRKIPNSCILGAFEFDVASLNNSHFPIGAKVAASSHLAREIPLFKRRDNHALAHSLRVLTPHRTYILSAPSEDEQIKWLAALQCLVDSRDPNDCYSRHSDFLSSLSFSAIRV